MDFSRAMGVNIGNLDHSNLPRRDAARVENVIWFFCVSTIVPGKHSYAQFHMYMREIVRVREPFVLPILRTVEHLFELSEHSSESIMKP